VMAASPDALVALTPDNLRTAYGLPNHVLPPERIAIVDAYDDPNAAVDLATYSAAYGLPACTTANGCFRKVNGSGASAPLPAYDAGWSLEIALDIQIAHAMCENCPILLVEAASPSLADLARAEETAARLGADVISNSYGVSEFSGEQNAAFNHPYVAIT